VKDHGGPCLQPHDIDELLTRCSNITKKKAALTAEIQYRKVILADKDKSLKSSGQSWEAMARCLKTSLGGIVDETETGKYCNPENICRVTLHLDYEYNIEIFPW
jgi:hypothetical protein